MTKVNGKPIEKEMIEQEMEQLRPTYEQTFKDMEEKKREEQLYDWSRENVIERVLIEQHAMKDGPEISEDELDDNFKKTMDRLPEDEEEMDDEQKKQIKDSIEMQLKVQKLLEKVCEDVDEPSEDEMKKFYEENKEEFKSPEEVKVSHVVKHIGATTTPEQAKETIEKAKEEIDQGKSFEQVVEKYSDCPGAGGDLGYFPRGRMVEEFEDIVFNMDTGEISDIFPTRFGYHIAKLYDRKQPEYYDFEDVKDHIKNRLTDEARRQEVEDFVDNLKEKSEIVRD